MRTMKTILAGALLLSLCGCVPDGTESPSPPPHGKPGGGGEDLQAEIHGSLTIQTLGDTRLLAESKEPETSLFYPHHGRIVSNGKCLVLEAEGVQIPTVFPFETRPSAEGGIETPHGVFSSEDVIVMDGVMVASDSVGHSEATALEACGFSGEVLLGQGRVQLSEGPIVDR